MYVSMGFRLYHETPNCISARSTTKTTTCYSFSPWEHRVQQQTKWPTPNQQTFRIHDARQGWSAVFAP